MAWLSANHFRPWLTFQAELLAFVGLALLFLGSIGLGKAGYWPAPALCIALLALLPVLQLTAGILMFAGDAWVSVIYLLALAAAIGLGFNWSRQPHPGPRTAAWTLVLCAPALLTACIGVLQWAHLSEALGIYALHLDFGDRPMGNMGQPNQLATFLLMGTCAFLCLFEERKAGVLLTLTALSLLGLVTALTQSRAGLLGATVASLFLWAKLGPLRGKTRLRPWHPLAWLAVTWMLSFAAPWVNDRLLLGGNRNISLTDSNSRDQIYLQVLHGVFQRPWWGYGWNQTSEAHRAGTIVFPGDTTISYAHSVVLDLVAWAGLPAGLLIVAGLVYWWVDRTARVTSSRGVLAMATLMPFLIHSLLEFPFAYAYFLLPAGLLAGVVEGSVAARAAVPVARRTLAALALAWAGLGGAVAWAYLLVEQDFQIVRFENLRTGRTPADYRPPAIFLLTHLEAMLAGARMRPAPGMSGEQIELLRKVSTRFQWGALDYRYAVALALNGDPAGASREFATMRGLYGERFYESVVIEFRALQEDRFPQLALVKT